MMMMMMMMIIHKHESATGSCQVAVNEGVIHVAAVELQSQLLHVASVQLQKPTAQTLLA